MKLFSSKRNQRNTAFAVLMLWTFAMGSGATNAWLVEAQDKFARVHMVAATKATSALGPRHENVHANTRLC